MSRRSIRQTGCFTELGRRDGLPADDGLSHAGIVAATFRVRSKSGVSRAGSAMTMVSFGLCGFQAAHAVHEPFYHVMPYLPLCLFLADRYAHRGHSLARLLGAGMGHPDHVGAFSDPDVDRRLGAFDRRVASAHSHSNETKGSLADHRPACGDLLGSRRRLGAIAADMGIECVRRLRSPSRIAQRIFISSHTMCRVRAARGLPRPLESEATTRYWSQNGAVLGEATAYVGIVPLILAFIGAIAAKRSDGLAPWRLIVPLSLVLATMAGWWPDGFAILLQIPGIGWFRAPSRYTLLTSLGLALLAGRGLDHSVTPHRFWVGLALAIAGGAAVWRWSLYWTRRRRFPSLHWRRHAAAAIWRPG